MPEHRTSAPCILMTVEGISFPFLLDTGAELSVMSKQVLQSTALPQPLDFYRLRNQAGDVFPDKVIRSFGGHLLTLKGPFVFTVFVCGIQLKHPFYTLDLPTPFVVGYDFITAAALLIDPVARRVCSKHTTGSSSNDFSPITPTAPTTLLNILVSQLTLHDPVHASNIDTARLCHSELTGDGSFIADCDVTTPKTLRFGAAQPPHLFTSLPDLPDNLDLLLQQPVNSANALLSSSSSKPTSCISPHFMTSPVTPPPLDGCPSAVPLPFSLPHTTTPFMPVPPTDHPPPTTLSVSCPCLPCTTGTEINNTAVAVCVYFSTVNDNSCNGVSHTNVTKKVSNIVLTDTDTDTAVSCVRFTQDADDLPDYLQDLFRTTVDDGNLTSDIIADFKTVT